jgi:polysaccharide biosynthesis protein PslH
MKDLLYLVHRIPYPPNKGDKIRSFNILKHLSTHYRIHLGTFIDDPDDWRYVPELEAYCTSLCVRPLSRRAGKLRSLTGLLTHEALTLPYFRDRVMARWVDRVLADGVERALVFSSPMAQYLPARRSGLHTVIDLVDVDSEKWREYAQRHRFPMSWIYRREGERLLAFERGLVSRGAALVLVTTEEAALLERLAPEVAGHVHVVENGVDAEYFSPEHAFDSPYEKDEAPVVFTGAMDYWANVDAVEWFARQILPAVRAVVPAAVFLIVGARPAPAVERLASLPGVRVTGGVYDVRPYLAHARVSVAPLRVARGVQNKVLEAMAMGVPVVATPEALDGLRWEPGAGVIAEQEPNAFARRVSDILADTSGRSRRQSTAAREWACTHYDWRNKLRGFSDLLELSTAGATPAAIPTVEPVPAVPAPCASTPITYCE